MAVGDRTIGGRVTEFAAALSFVWLGMVLGISFMETPLKFRGPGMTLALGLGIGRLVFSALNAIEVVLAIVIAVALLSSDPSTSETTVLIVLIVCIVAQVGLLRPRLNRRTDLVLAGETPPGSRLHLGYIGLELVKVGLLISLGTLALQA